jgi:hypothetical protein
MGESTFTRRGAGGSSASVIKYTNAGVLTDTYSSISKISNPTPLSQKRGGVSAGRIGDYALFAGGSTGPTVNSSVDAYNTSLVRSNPTSLSSPRLRMGVSNVGNFILFGGGNSYVSTVEAYNTSLTKSSVTSLSSGRDGPQGTKNNNYALFCGGDTNTAPTYLSVVVDAYNSSLTRSIPASLLQPVGDSGGINTPGGNYALLAGGRRQSGSAPTVHAYDNSLTLTITTNIPGRYYLTSSIVGNYSLFAGGYGTAGGASIEVDAFDNNLTRYIATQLSTGRAVANAGSLLGNALVAGGYNFSTQQYLSSVDTYNASLTRSSTSGLSQAKRGFRSAVVGNYLLFGGGDILSDNSDSVDIYTQSVTGSVYQLITPQLSNFTITYKYDFNTIGTGTASEGQTLSSTTTFTGTLEFPENIS